MEELRCMGSGRIYIRSIQIDIPLSEEVNVGEQCEECLFCKSPISLSAMRQHMETCTVSIFMAIETIQVLQTVEQIERQLNHFNFLFLRRIVVATLGLCCSTPTPVHYPAQRQPHSFQGNGGRLCGGF